MKKLPIICYLLGIILIAITLKIRSGHNTQKSAYIAVNENLDLNEFLNSEKFEFYGEKYQLKPNHITALFVISSAQCKPCINEVINFNYFFLKYNLKTLPIQQCVAIIDSSKKRALRFIKTTEFITPVVFGNDEKYVPFLHSFGSRKVNRQLLLINNNSNTVFFRIHLKKGKMTSESLMKKIIKNAEIALINNLL